MARKALHNSIRPFTEINLTPLIDLVFLLLVTFIITFPQIEQGIPIKLPKGNVTDKVSEKSHTITVDKKGDLFLDNTSISLEKLGARILEMGRKDPDTAIRVRADEGIQYGRVVDVVKLLHEAKITKMALVTLPEDAKRVSR
jgi:biopolymer transport protein ExbD